MMRQTENITELAAALAKAQGQISAAPKDALNPHFGKKYADLASVWGACRAALAEHGIAVLQPPATTANGTVEVTTRLLHSSGQWIEETLALTPTKNDPQGVGSAITYAKRYGLAGMVGVVADEDDDGNAASAPKAKAEPAKQQQREPAKAKEPTLTPEQNLFNAFVQPLVKAGRLTRENVTAALAEHKGDYTKAREYFEQLVAEPASQA